MKDKITPISAEDVGEPTSHIMQSRLTKGSEGVKPASVRIQELEKELSDCERERDEAILRLRTLVDLKVHKDFYGKTDFYLESQPSAWRTAKAFLSTLEKNNES